MNYRTQLIILLFINVFLFRHETVAQNVVPTAPFVQSEELVSLTKALMYDIFPGGGHIYTGHYEYAAVFAAAKLSGIYALYYFYNYWNYRASLYRSAKKANEQLDPTHELLFKDPEGGYKTVKEFGYAYDRAAHYFTLSIIANVAIYVASWMVTYYSVRDANEARLPLYEISANPQFLLTYNAEYGIYGKWTTRW